jgi:hypothetical protein
MLLGMARPPQSDDRRRAVGPVPILIFRPSFRRTPVFPGENRDEFETGSVLFCSLVAPEAEARVPRVLRGTSAPPLASPRSAVFAAIFLFPE